MWWGIWRRLEAGDQEDTGAGTRGYGMVSTQFGFNKHLGEDPEAREGSILGRSKEPGLSDTTREAVMGTVPREGDSSISFKLPLAGNSTSRSHLSDTHRGKNRCTELFSTALLVVIGDWKQPKCPPMRG